MAELRLRDSLHARVLSRIDDCLAGLDDQALLFKGEALARQVYPQSWLRQRTDIDLWVRPEHLAAMVDGLRDRGCRLTAGVSSRFARFELVLDAGMSVPVGIDVHVRPFFRPWRLPHLDFERVLAQSVPCPDWPRLYRPGAADALVLAAVHLDKNAHQRAIWLYDLFLLGADPDTRARAMAEAQKSGEGPVLARGLAWADYLFGGGDCPTEAPTRVPGKLSALWRDARALPDWTARGVFLAELLGIGVHRWKP
ncbi:MAG: nucleotidyltransferase family protein [Ahniella sp.]|nr:nucleotidyltransferase family protein [Ahniella sp.]